MTSRVPSEVRMVRSEPDGRLCAVWGGHAMRHAGSPPAWTTHGAPQVATLQTGGETRSYLYERDYKQQRTCTDIGRYR
jgi:hypothetical protein